MRNWVYSNGDYNKVFQTKQITVNKRQRIWKGKYAIFTCDRVLTIWLACCYCPCPYLQANHNFFKLEFLKGKTLYKTNVWSSERFLIPCPEVLFNSDEILWWQKWPQILNALSEAFSKKIKGCIPNSSCESKNYSIQGRQC